MSESHEQRDSRPTDDGERARFNAPNTFCAIRLAGSFFLVALALTGNPRLFLLVFLIVASTDWVDGKLAILLNQRTTFGARFDSVADAAMYASMLFGCVWMYGATLRQEALWIGAALACYAISCGSALWKYGRLPSHHTYSAKAAWGVTVLAAIALFTDWAVWPLRVAAAAVALANLESTSITWLSDRWLADVPSVWCVRRRRQQESSAGTEPR